MPGDYLSPEGRRRQELILQMALRDMRNTRRRRWILPGAGVTVAMGLVVLMSLPKPAKHEMVAMKPVPEVRAPIVTHAGAEAPRPVETVLASPVINAAKTPENPPIIPAVQYVTTDSTITDRMTPVPQAPRWVAVDDDQFVKELADAGKPMGLAYVNGKAILLGQE